MTAETAPRTAGSASPIVVLRDVSLCYRLAKQRLPSLKDYAIHWMKGALSYEKLWALRDVSLDIPPGQALGVIGRNGAGKSTLLKVVTGVLKPTAGQVQVEGRVAPILELGTGFDIELTGRENIYLNALLLGHTLREVDVKFREIVDFSGLGKFIHSPIRNYSSGMVARLGFSIATAWTPDLLILDEVLAVGDAGFLRQCQERLDAFRLGGTTVILVSHDVRSVRLTCERAIWLDQGVVQGDGPAGEVVEAYLSSTAGG